MWIKKISFYLVMSLLCGAAKAQVGECDVNSHRVLTSVEVRSGSVKDNEESVTGQAVCSGAPVIVRKCAVVDVKYVRAQYFCFSREGTPTVAEEHDIIEYQRRQ